MAPFCIAAQEFNEGFFEVIIYSRFSFFHLQPSIRARYWSYMYVHTWVMAKTHWFLGMLKREVTDHPGVSHLVLSSWGVWESANVGAEETVSLCGGPDPPVHVMKNDCVITESFHDFSGLNCLLPFHASVICEEEIGHLLCRNSLQ